MCGRSRCTLDPSRVAAATGVEAWVDGDPGTSYEPTYNLSPGHVGVVERRTDNGKEVVVQPMR